MSLTLPLLLAGCDAFGPDRKQVTWTRCNSTEQGTWFAFRNEPGDWHVADNAASNFTFEASRRLTIAYAGSTPTVISLTREELQGMECVDLFLNGTRNITGSVTGLSSGQEVEVLASGGGVGGTTGAFTLPAVAGPVDVFAYTQNDFGTPVPQKLIVRRDVMGATLAPLDFSSSEAVNFAQATISLSGAGTTTFGRSITFFAPGLSRNLTGQGNAAAPMAYFGFPASLLRSDEVHAVRYSDEGDFRSLRFFYQTPRDTAIDIGPPAAAGTHVQLNDPVCERYRVTIPWQPDYRAGATASFNVRVGPQLIINMDVHQTEAFRGGSADAWVLEMPEFKRPDGSCAMLPGPLIGIQTTVRGGRGPIASWPPAVGVVERTASAHVTVP